ncbi:MAG: DNA repair protein RecO [Planctomycetota bacterium]
MPRFIDDAICLRELEWSETSQVLVFLTKEHGKVRGIAKGSKRQSPSAVQRFSGGVALLTAGQVVATTRPSRELASITEWDLQEDFFTLRRDLLAQRRAMLAVDLVNALLADLDPHGDVFGLLRALLDALCSSDAAAGDGALLRFLWGLLDGLGYRPELQRDVRGGGALADEAAYTFDPDGGGLTAERGIADWRVRAATVRTLRAVADSGESQTLDPPSVTRANRLLCVYARHLLGRELPTMRVVLRG